MIFLKGKTVAEKESSDKEDVKKELTAEIVLVVTDDGQFGSPYCGKCNFKLPQGANFCPKCGLKLTGSRLHPGFGGSDF